MMLVDQVAQLIRESEGKVGAGKLAEVLQEAIVEAISDLLVENAGEWQEEAQVMWRKDTRGQTMWSEMPEHQVKRLAEAIREMI